MFEIFNPMICNFDFFFDQELVLLQLICAIDHLIMLIYFFLKLIDAVRLQLIALIQLGQQLAVLGVAIDDAHEYCRRRADERRNDRFHPRPHFPAARNTIIAASSRVA